MVQPQAGIIKDNLHSHNLLVDIKDIILVVLLWEVSSWHYLDLFDLCMNCLVLRNLSKKDVWLIGRNSVIAVVSYVSVISSTVSTVGPILLFIWLGRIIVNRLGRSLAIRSNSQYVQLWYLS